MMRALRMVLSFGLALVPLISLVFEMVSRFDIEERHHIHHDTYSVSLVITRTLMLVEGFMGILGLLVCWLSRVGIYGAIDPFLPISFFLSFEVALLAMQVAVGRYQVVTYLDRLTVTPFVGSQRTMRYRDIAQMEWRERIPGSFVRDLHLIAKDGSQIAIWGILDIDQMLLRIDRFDVLEV